MLDLQDILKLHDKAYLAGQNNRERASDDLLFARLTQWDDTILGDTLLEYRGEFDQIRKARRHVLSDMRQNPVQVSYAPQGDAEKEDADLLDGMYRTYTTESQSKQCEIIAQQDQVDCGFGAWRLTTEYEYDNNDLINQQVIKRVPIHGANNNVYFDPGANLMDKSDGYYCSIIHSFNEDSYKRFAEDIGIDPDDLPSSFRPPEDSFVFPWLVEDKQIHISEFYYRKKKLDTVYIYENPLGETAAFLKHDLKEVGEETLAAMGYELIARKKKTIWIVEKYYVSGGAILKYIPRISGQYIPVVPVYGEWSKVENYEVWEGITRRAKDPQRLRNFMMSYLADIVYKGARRRPFFYPEQIQGFEFMYEQGGADNNYPYYLLNRYDANGAELPMGAINYMENPEIPPAVGGLMDAVSGAISDVTTTGADNMDGNPNLAEKTVLALQNQVDMQTYTYIDNLAEAKRLDAKIYASIAQEINDVPRTVTVTAENGSQSTAQLLDEVIDEETGQKIVLRDLSKGGYNVSTSVGAAYSTKRAQDRAELMELYVQTEDPQIKNLIMLEVLNLSDGSSKALSKYARQQLLATGLVEPENQEEEDYLQQMMQQQEAAQNQPDPMEEYMASEASKNMAVAQKEQANTQQILAKSENIQVDTAQKMKELEQSDLDRADKALDLAKKETEIAAQQAGIVNDRQKSIADMINMRMQNNQSQMMN